MFGLIWLGLVLIDQGVPALFPHVLTVPAREHRVLLPASTYSFTPPPLQPVALRIGAWVWGPFAKCSRDREGSLRSEGAVLVARATVAEGDPYNPSPLRNLAHMKRWRPTSGVSSADSWALMGIWSGDSVLTSRRAVSCHHFSWCRWKKETNQLCLIREQ